MPERLAKIFVVFVQAHLGCRIQQPADSDRGVDEQAGQIIAGRAEFSLQGIVDHDGRGAQIRHKITDAGARRRRHRSHIGPRNGLGHRAVELVIEFVYAAIERFPWILRGRLAVGGQRDTSRHQGDYDAKQHACVPYIRHIESLRGPFIGSKIH